MTASEASSGVSSCYVFKSRLQEYAQRHKLSTPIYETVKEGPSHRPLFQTTVIVDGVRYDSLPGFFNRKAAEQSAAEVALQELAKSSELSHCVSPPIHEMGLCKNLLQDYAQKMNYAIPMYHCQKSETPGRCQHFTCTVEIGGIKYTGAATKTKKVAEISACRTALIAIQSESNTNLGSYNTQLTVLPCEKKTSEVASPVKETIKTPKARKAQFKKKKKKAKKIKLQVAKDHEDNSIIPPPPTEHCQSDQSETIIIETTLNQEPSYDQSETITIETTLNQEPSYDQSETITIETTLNQEPCSCMNGLKEAAFVSVETDASQA